MGRLKILAILAILISILIFAQGAALIYFEKSKGAEPPGYEKNSEEQEDLKRKYTELFNKFEAIKKDRDNVLIQTSLLLEEKKNAGKLKESLEKLQTEKQLLEEEKEHLLSQHQKLEEEIEQLLDTRAQIEEERDHFREAYEKVKKDIAIKESKKTISALQEENKKIQQENKQRVFTLLKERDKLEHKFGKAQKEIGRLKKDKDKAEKKIVELSGRLNELKKNYAAAVKKNKTLEQEVKNIPRKFSEIARQNKKLIKNTSRIHYNLGVFYTKNKEYKRALAEFEKAVEINPEDAYAHFNSGYIYAEYLVARKKAIEHFRHFLRLARGDDEDIDWVKKYLLTWETFEGKKPIK